MPSSRSEWSQQLSQSDRNCWQIDHIVQGTRIYSGETPRENDAPPLGWAVDDTVPAAVLRPVAGPDRPQSAELEPVVDTRGELEV